MKLSPKELHFMWTKCWSWETRMEVSWGSWADFSKWHC